MVKPQTKNPPVRIQKVRSPRNCAKVEANRYAIEPVDQPTALQETIKKDWLRMP